MTHTNKIVEYRESWPDDFIEEKALILSAIGDKVFGVEHIGSTAVPGLPAKPIIDIMVGTGSIEDSDRCIQPLAGADYEYRAIGEEFFPERRYFRKGPAERHRHLHMVVYGTDFWRLHILFRDYLRKHPEAAMEYGAIKKEISRQYPIEKDEYTLAKTDFIEGVLARAKIEMEGSD